MNRYTRKGGVTVMDERTHCNLRSMIDTACAGVMPHIADRIKDAARKAYYLGCADGMQLANETRKDAGRAA